MDATAPFPVTEHAADLCIVGGGLSGLCAAIAAARRGARVVLMHDRPVLGGNASSECRMHICGADRSNHTPHLRETGLLEELRLENIHRNPQRSFSAWDLVLYDKVRAEASIELLLNCSCLGAEADGAAVRSVTGWQTTTQTYHRVCARLFADCSGDGVLGPLTGAQWRMGREARSEFGESIAPEQADARTMGMTCMFQAREHATPQPFRPPAWAHRFPSCDDLPYGAKGHGYWEFGYWWIELGGEYHSINDTERLRDELLKITLGVWDHIKNSGRHDADRWALEWIQFLPGKRESRRFVGDHVLNQNDVEAGGRFADVIAYGGWPMDDHHPAGFRAVRLSQPATIFHPVPVPFGIPYRILYSRNIGNLMFAGRNVSCTHAALSSTRVMATCAMLGQAMGTAAALALRHGVSPREIGGRIGELQQALLDDDCYLPGVAQRMPELTQGARLTASAGDPGPVRDGVGRQVGGDSHAWLCPPGGQLTYEFAGEAPVDEAVLVLDSAMDRLIASVYAPGYPQPAVLPAPLPRAFRLEGLTAQGWQTVHREAENRRRHVRIPVARRLQGVRFVLESTWGQADASRVYAFYVR